MFIGAYWSSRPESRLQSAQRIVYCLRDFAAISEPLGRWFHKGRRRSGANKPLELSPSVVAQALGVNRRDVGGEIMTEAGFRLGVWNGCEISVSVVIGADKTVIPNSMVVSFGDDETTPSRADIQRLLDAMICHLEPEHAVATDVETLNQNGAEQPWEVGVFTYERGGQVQLHG